MKFTKPESLKDATTHYCSGCGHGIAHRLVAEVLDELNLREKTIGTAPVGCAVLLYDYFNIDIIECSHGRPPAVATAMKRLMPDKILFTYQGDGDLAAIVTTVLAAVSLKGALMLKGREEKALAEKGITTEEDRIDFVLQKNQEAIKTTNDDLLNLNILQKDIGVAETN